MMQECTAEITIFAFCGCTFSQQDGLTANEFDALNLTATSFDAYQITAYEFDSSGKVILV